MEKETNDPLEQYVPNFNFEIHVCTDTIKKNGEPADMQCVLIADGRRVDSIENTSDEDLQKLLSMTDMLGEYFLQELNDRFYNKLADRGQISHSAIESMRQGRKKKLLN